MNNEIKEKFLPIGTVVLLKGGQRKIMITSYCPVPKGDIYDKKEKIELDKDKVFDYGGCFYPEGIINSNRVFIFNHDQIEKVFYMGYESEESNKFNEILKEEIAKKESQQ